MTVDDDEEDIDVDDLNDKDFSIHQGRRSNTRRGRRREKPTVKKIIEREEEILEDTYSDSDSDGEWTEGPSKKSKRRKRRRSKSKRARRLEAPEDDDVAHTVRINARTGGTVNYFEGDDDSFTNEEQSTATGALTSVDDGSPRIETVVDFRYLDGTSHENKESPPFSDFEEHKVEFRIKWIGTSFRKCTWETWEQLRVGKGHKKVRNYINMVKDRKAYFISKTIRSLEEEEDARVTFQENRVALEKFEIVDRVIAQREVPGDPPQTEYLVKWTNVNYADCTWERLSELNSELDQKAIDDYKDREQQALTNASKKRLNPFNSKDERPRFKKMAEQPSYLHGEGRTLRKYQLAGLNFLAFSWTKRNNVILADEMGLGKTLQTISFIGWLKYVASVSFPCLVIVPLSTIAAWVREFARWLPDLNVICYNGDGKSRKTIREYEFWSTAKSTIEKFDVLLTTPELIMMDEEYLEGFRWAMIAVDEAHRLKNETSALHITLAGLRSANRLLVTGTPLQNSIRELWALLHFLNRERFGSAEEFEEKFSFSSLRDPDRVANLHQTLRPYIIRRQKKDVEKSLPKKTYHVLRVGMTSDQQRYYRWLLTKNFAMLNKGSRGRSSGSVSTLKNLVMELKKCCNHPYLFPDYEDTSTTTTVDVLIRASGKLILLDKLLLRLREKGHRVLIFSQMVRMLDILQDYCRMRNFPFQRLDGSMHNEARQRAVDHYNAPESNDFVFLLSTRAGGLGINLATADTVVIFDSDWNPQNDLQAESRAHRIGQTRDVKVFRLLTRETVEENILERAKRKRVLEHLVIHGVEGGGQNDSQNMFKKEELSAILRFGAESLFQNNNDLSKPKLQENGKPNDMDEDEPTPSKLAEHEKDGKAEEKRVLEVDDIDELLARAPTDEEEQVGGAQESVGESLLNAFQWADFKTGEEDEVHEDDGVGNQEMAKEAANKVTTRDKEAEKAKQEETADMENLAKEGDFDFWNRVIPGDLKESAMVDEMTLGTRRRKRPKTFSADSPREGKRRRASRHTRSTSGKVTESRDLTLKEQKSFFRSVRKFGDPSLVEVIIKDAGLEERLDSGLASSMFEECVEKAKQAIAFGPMKQNGTRKKSEDESDPEYNSKGTRHASSKKSKSSKIVFDVLGERSVDAKEFLKRCDDLQMLRKHIATFDPDTQFRFRDVIKPPSFAVRWKGQQDAMLLVGVCRHGFGNWIKIAADSQLGLSDKISVSGNPKAVTGAPDATKLTRRVVTLLKELEKQTRPTQKQKSKPREKEAKSKSSKKLKVSQRITKSRRKGGRSSRFESITAAKGRESKTQGDSKKVAKIRQALKEEHFTTLRELRALSKKGKKMEPTVVIDKTKECLLEIGNSITKHDDPIVQVSLWNYVHELCRTNLAGDRLQAIYDRVRNTNPR